MRKYYRVDFKTRKRFNASEKSIITRRYNKINAATQSEFRFVKNKKFNGHLNTTKGSFVRVPSTRSTVAGNAVVTGDMAYIDVPIPRSMVIDLMIGTIDHTDIDAYVRANKDVIKLLSKYKNHNFAILYKGRHTSYAGPSDFTSIRLIERYLPSLNNISSEKIIGVRVNVWGAKNRRKK